MDGLLCDETVGQRTIDQGVKIRAPDPGAGSGRAPAPRGRVPRPSSRLDVTTSLHRVNAILHATHADGTLKAWSKKDVEGDHATRAGRFDLSSIGQELPQSPSHPAGPRTGLSCRRPGPRTLLSRRRPVGDATP